VPEDRRQLRDAPVVAPEPGTIWDKFATALTNVAVTPTQGPTEVILIVDAKDAHMVLETARNHPALKMDFLRDLCGVDYEEQGLEVVYHLWSYELRHGVTVRAKVPVEDPHIQSATDLWKAADWHERECRDMFGIVFDGHPNLVPILLPEDMLDHFPLRKENPLAPLEEWQGEQLGSEMGKAGYIPAGSGFDVTPEEEEE
jgi:NADH:ubiquinone oxidoreductase subunit C